MAIFKILISNPRVQGGLSIYWCPLQPLSLVPYGFMVDVVTSLARFIPRWVLFVCFCLHFETIVTGVSPNFLLRKFAIGSWKGYRLWHVVFVCCRFAVYSSESFPLESSESFQCSIKMSTNRDNLNSFFPTDTSFFSCFVALEFEQYTVLYWISVEKQAALIYSRV